MPPYRVGIALDYDLDRLHLGFETAHSGAQARVAVNELPTDGFTLVSLDARYRWKMSRGSLFAFLRGENLLNEEARQHISPLKACLAEARLATLPCIRSCIDNCTQGVWRAHDDQGP